MSGNKLPLQAVEKTGGVARAAAVTFVDRWSREMGGESPRLRDRMRFAHEMGYLRGYGGGLLARGEDVGASERARFTAREFVARWSRETDEGACWARVPGEGVVMDRMCFSYEIGYLQGHGAGVLAGLPSQDHGAGVLGVPAGLPSQDHGAGVLASVGLHNKSDRNMDDAEHK